MKFIIGVESTAHTFGVSVIDLDGNILSNCKKTYETEKGGLIPIELKKHHEENSDSIYNEAIKKANISESDVVCISFSCGPGLAPALLVGLNFSKKKAKFLNVPLIPVNHCIAHLEIGETTGSKDPVLLYVSGANTQIIAYESGRYRIFGETLDLGVGNFIDTIARHIGLGFPGGPKIQALAKNYAKKFKNSPPEIIELPYVIKGMDVSFSGIQTKIKKLIDNGEDIERVAYSLQEYVFAILVEASERAIAHTGKNELLLGGGVACNSRLQEMCKIMCDERKIKYFCPDNSLLVDNAAMIAYLGLKIFKKGIFERNLNKIDISPRQRTDEVFVFWRD